MSDLTGFTVTITDVIDWTITINAPSRLDAYDQAWELYMSKGRAKRFRRHEETTTNVEEVQS